MLMLSKIVVIYLIPANMCIITMLKLVLLFLTMFTQVRSANRRVSPVEVQNHKTIMKVVYLVLEPQYQIALTQAAKNLNSSNKEIGIQLSGYLIEELRSEDNFENFKADISSADVFIASHIFIEDLAQ